MKTKRRSLFWFCWLVFGAVFLVGLSLEQVAMSLGWLDVKHLPAWFVAYLLLGPAATLFSMAIKQLAPEDQP